LTENFFDHYLMPMAHRFLHMCIFGKRLVAAVLMLAVLGAGWDVHSDGAASAHRKTDGLVASATSDHGAAPSSHIGGVVDHHCHGCVVLMAIESDDVQRNSTPPMPAMSKIATLTGIAPGFPTRPPRQKNPIF
jgi:hypothetical protein